MGEASGEASGEALPACPVEFENHSTRVKIKDKFKT